MSSIELILSPHIAVISRYIASDDLSVKKKPHDSLKTANVISCVGVVIPRINYPCKNTRICTGFLLSSSAQLRARPWIRVQMKNKTMITRVVKTL